LRLLVRLLRGFSDEATALQVIDEEEAELEDIV